ncbi:hypothetical protein NXX09_20370 [Bacteroides uniformis]|nr:hypothetical protein [Bacteroides uniformis]
MGKYRVVAGQNIYDVALYLYGSIEGVVDLLINNPDLSFATTLTAGRELVYTDDFVIRADVVAYNGLHGIVPANGERHVYPKTFTLPLAVVLTLAAGIITVQCAVSGAGQLEIGTGRQQRHRDRPPRGHAAAAHPYLRQQSQGQASYPLVYRCLLPEYRRSGLKPRSLVPGADTAGGGADAHARHTLLGEPAAAFRNLQPEPVELRVGRSCTACRMPGTDDTRPLRRPTETDSHRSLPDNPCGTLRRPTELHGHFTYSPDGNLSGAGPGYRNGALPYRLGHGSRMGHPARGGLE